jgi:multidrug efflux system membrane fusion protein
MRRSLFTVVVLALTPAIGGLVLSSCKSRQRQAGGPSPAVPVSVGKATVESAPVEVRVVGSIEPSAKVEVKSQVDGRLIAVHFREGQDVKEGDLLLEIDPQPYREALRQAEAAVERDRAQLREAQAALERDVVQSKAADADAARYAQLRKEHIASEQQELQFRTTAEAMKRTLEADRAAIETARGNLAVDEAAASQARLNLSYCQIRAPISGRTGNLLVNAGNLIKANDAAVVVINRITPVFVSFNAPEKDLGAIRRHSASGSLPVDVISRENPEIKETGRLTVIDNTVDTQTGTIHLKATLPNAQRRFWPGQFVNVVLTVSENQSATVIPAAAVQPGQKGQMVYVVKSDKTVEPRIVSLSRTLGEKVIVESGVTPGETVVTDGQMLLFPGAHVSLAPTPDADIGIR